MADDFNTDSMLDMYLFENGQLLEQLQETVLEQKDADSFDEDSINEIFRTMHTIKGSSGIMMFDNITAVSHKLEDVFFYLRESHPEHVPHVELVEHVLEVEDFISNEMEKIRGGETPDGDASDLIKNLDKFLDMIKNGGAAGGEDAGAGTRGAEAFLYRSHGQRRQPFLQDIRTFLSGNGNVQRSRVQNRVRAEGDRGGHSVFS